MSVPTLQKTPCNRYKDKRVTAAPELIAAGSKNHTEYVNVLGGRKESTVRVEQHGA